MSYTPSTRGKPMGIYKNNLLLFFLTIFAGTSIKAYESPTIVIIGTGYVGLVTGTCFAHLGNKVICVDIDEQKINDLNNGIVSLFEPDLETLIRSHQGKTLSFTTDASTAISAADIIFVAVDTPMCDDGTANMDYLHAALTTIGKSIKKKTIICIKSTVPIGTTARAQEILIQQGADPALFDMAMNPEFLREGTAVYDFLHPDRIVIGSHSKNALHTLEKLYAPLIKEQTPCIMVDPETAETIKYASNSLLAIKISFINEIANLCEKTGANICAVAHAMGLDKRIGPFCLKHGPGFGGSCFPKDCSALLHMGKQYGVTLNTLAGCLQTNKKQRKVPVQKLLSYLPDLHGKTIAVLGLTFKAGTNDIRNSCAITAIKQLKKHGAHIKAHDPVANEIMKKLFPDIEYGACIISTVTDCDAALILTDWPEFKELETPACSGVMKHPIIIDACNVLDEKKSNTLPPLVIDKIGKKSC
jgi:UDPglucose 6-dehydrogenase